MKIVVITNDELKAELLAQRLQENVQIEWQTDIHFVQDADAYIDLLFNNAAERTDELKKLHSPLIIVNAVNNTLKEMPTSFVRINGWNGFLKRPLIEAAGADENKAAAEKIFANFNKTAEWVSDMPGFVTPRVISSIINEAYFTLEEKVSTKEEIDTAMKLGTNYPYGPFEWSEMIGVKKVYSLLLKLAETNFRYTPSALLQKEALA